MHDMIELAHNVIAGEHHDHPRCATSTAVGARHRVHLAASTDCGRAVQGRNGHHRHHHGTASAPGRQRVWVSCPVQRLCLAWAVLAGIAHGVWAD
jgi:hypothetical protein